MCLCVCILYTRECVCVCINALYMYILYNILYSIISYKVNWLGVVTEYRIRVKYRLYLMALYYLLYAVHYLLYGVQCTLYIVRGNIVYILDQNANNCQGQTCFSQQTYFLHTHFFIDTMSIDEL